MNDSTSSGMTSNPQLSRTSSRHYFYRKSSLPSIAPPVNEDESTKAFEQRLIEFIQRPLVQQTAREITETAESELARRKAERKARKERERGKSTEELPTREDGPLFSKLNELTLMEREAWLANINDEAMLLNPHQWLKLGNLFNVNSKVARQTSVLPRLACLPEVLQDREIQAHDLKPLENYLELRDVQNRNYARDSVAEGIKLVKSNKYKEAMEHYKRALDMDPKYADGWFHVAEAFVNQNKLKEAKEHLEKVLRLEADHEGAKALLAGVNHALDPKPVKKDTWDLVDENGQDLTPKRSPSRKRRHVSRSPSRSRKRRSSPRRRSRDKSSRRKYETRSRERKYDRRESRRDRSREKNSRRKYESRDSSSRRNRDKKPDRKYERRSSDTSPDSVKDKLHDSRRERKYERRSRDTSLDTRRR